MRVIAGRYRSRQLKSLKGLSLRPTSDMLRETLFNILGPRVEGSRFLELFAGTGAVGIEAISRGAALAVFVENHSAAVRLIRENLSSLEITSEARVIPSKVSTAIAKLQNEPADKFDFIFFDPPYANEADYGATLDLLENSSLAEESTIVIAEHHKKFRMPKSVCRLQQFRTLVQGDAALTFYRRSCLV
jgi:16S rRNA (guanine966-N2)-methyltransferase